MKGSFSSEGIILYRRDYGESDRLVVIFTKKYGKLTFIAKGVRRPVSRKRGHIEVFSRVNFQGFEGKGLPVLTEVEVIDNYKKIRKELPRITVAYYLLEVINKITSLGEPQEEIFVYLKNTLEELETKKALLSLRKDFVTKVLVFLGFWPVGKKLLEPDAKFQEIIENRLGSLRVGKKLLS